MTPESRPNVFTYPAVISAATGGGMAIVYTAAYRDGLSEGIIPPGTEVPNLFQEVSPHATAAFAGALWMVLAYRLACHSLNHPYSAKQEAWLTCVGATLAHLLYVTISSHQI